MIVKYRQDKALKFGYQNKLYYYEMEKVKLINFGQMTATIIEVNILAEIKGNLEKS